MASAKEFKQLFIIPFMDLLLLCLVILSFLLSLVFVRLTINYHMNCGIADVNYARKDDKKIALAGGIGLVIPLWISSLIAIYFFGFIFEIVSIALLVTVFALIGYIDDRNPKFLKKSLGWKVRALPMAVAALIFAGVFSFNPLFLWIIPLALFVAGFASLINTFEGLNCWGVGTGTIILIFISIYFFVAASPMLFYALILTAISFGLVIFNKYPAKTLPGDSGTLFIGSSIVGVTLASADVRLIILVILFFIPALIDFFVLKIISNPKDISQSKSRPYKILGDGRLTIPDGKATIDFAKLLMKKFGPMHEGEVVALIWLIVVINCSFWFLLFTLFIF